MTVIQKLIQNHLQRTCLGILSYIYQRCALTSTDIYKRHTSNCCFVGIIFNNVSIEVQS